MIKNIIFDLGNVLYDLDEAATEKALRQFLDPTKSSDLLEQVIYPFDKGLISEEAFFNRLQRRAIGEVDVIDLRNAWNAMLLGLPENRIEMLYSLKAKYRLFLLSNNNIVHYRYLQRQFHKQMPGLNFDKDFFEKAYYSFLINKRKPDLDCYHYVLEDAGILSHESLFIDDKIENIEAAASIGFITYMHDPCDDIQSVLPELLII